MTRGGEIPDSRRDATFAAALGGFNAGMDGYSTCQERDLFKHDLASLHAKKVVLFVCLNDIMTEKESQDMIKVTLKENFDIGKWTLLDNEPYYRIARWLRARAAFRSWLAQDPDARTTALSRVDRLELAGAKPVDAKVWREWTDCILDIHKAAAPSRFYLVLAPLRPHIGAYREGRRDFWVNQELARFCKAHGIPVLDLLPAFARAKASRFESFGDPFHFTLTGHRIATQALRDFLEDDKKKI